MTDEELRRLKRSDLLELLVAQERENEALRQQLRQAQEALAARTIQMEEAGNIAEAALRLNGVFEAAQAAANLYLASIRERAAAQEDKDHA